MADQWLKPDFQEIGVSGECTAYAGALAASETGRLLPVGERDEQGPGNGPRSSPAVIPAAG
jgi:hypothetical protein